MSKPAPGSQFPPPMALVLKARRRERETWALRALAARTAREEFIAQKATVVFLSPDDDLPEPPKAH